MVFVGQSCALLLSASCFGWGVQLHSYGFWWSDGREMMHMANTLQLLLIAKC